jgi:hypothetical protein
LHAELFRSRCKGRLDARAPGWSAGVFLSHQQTFTGTTRHPQPVQTRRHLVQPSHPAYPQPGAPQPGPHAAALASPRPIPRPTAGAPQPQPPPRQPPPRQPPPHPPPCHPAPPKPPWKRCASAALGARASTAATPSAKRVFLTIETSLRFRNRVVVPMRPRRSLVNARAANPDPVGLASGWGSSRKQTLTPVKRICS